MPCSSTDYRPEKIRHTKLRDHVLDIVQRHMAGETAAMIARDLNVNPSSVEAIVKGDVYRDIERPIFLRGIPKHIYTERQSC